MRREVTRVQVSLAGLFLLGGCISFGVPADRLALRPVPRTAGSPFPVTLSRIETVNSSGKPTTLKPAKDDVASTLRRSLYEGNVLLEPDSVDTPPYSLDIVIEYGQGEGFFSADLRVEIAARLMRPGSPLPSWVWRSASTGKVSGTLGRMRREAAIPYREALQQLVDTLSTLDIDNAAEQVDSLMLRYRSRPDMSTFVDVVHLVFWRVAHVDYQLWTSNRTLTGWMMFATTKVNSNTGGEAAQYMEIASKSLSENVQAQFLADSLSLRATPLLPVDSTAVLSSLGEPLSRRNSLWYYIVDQVQDSQHLGALRIRNGQVAELLVFIRGTAAGE